MTTTPEPSFSLNVDVTNPGQFFACCGALELAHRLWPGTEGWFQKGGCMFHLTCGGDPSANLDRLMRNFCESEITGLSQAERQERATLEAEKRRLKKEGKGLSPDQEQRRKALGAAARKGDLLIGDPFGVRLDWWQTGDDDAAVPKTWAGPQEIERVARATQEGMREITAWETALDYATVMREAADSRKTKRGKPKKVEPFYFDARRFADALDVGYSLDVQKAETVAHPAVELLCLVGLQRFRPAPAAKWEFAYAAWFDPLPAPVAAAVVGGAVVPPSSERYVFRFQFRDNQRRYKAFGFATPA